MMDAEGMKFGRGPRELTGAMDLLNYYKLLPHHNFFCKRALPSSISDTHYLYNVVGDTEIRKGEGMELDQLFNNVSYVQNMASSIQPFDLDALRQAFQLREAEPVELPAAEKGIPTTSGKSTAYSKDKEKKHKKHKDRDKEKDRERKKHKHRDKEKSKDKERDKSKKDGSGNHEGGDDHSKKHHEKKRRHEENGDATDSHKHKKKKHRDSRGDDIGLTKDKS